MQVKISALTEKIITIARNDTVHARRLVNTKIKDREVLSKLFDTIAPSFINRPGGYTRIIKLNHRRGDAAPVSAIELVGLNVPFKVEHPEETKSETPTSKDKD